MAWEADALEAGIGPCGQRHVDGIHESTVEVGVTCGVIEMRVGVDDIAQGLRSQRLTVATQIAGTIAGIDADSRAVAFDEIGVVTVGEDALCARCNGSDWNHASSMGRQVLSGP